MTVKISNFYKVSLLDPIADAFAGTLNTDIVNCQGHGVVFTIGKGVGATGTSTITISACDDVTPSNTTDVIFWYRAMTTMGTWGDWTAATATGFTTTAGSSQLYECYVPADVLGASTYGYARLNAVEVVDNPVLGYVLAEVVNTRYSTQTATLLT
jgi:hypothetical protein